MDAAGCLDCLADFINDFQQALGADKNKPSERGCAQRPASAPPRPRLLLHAKAPCSWAQSLSRAQ
jgi:hypothetical protein